MEELQTKHRKEQRDLQSRITQKKKNATKKTRKGVNDECERLERDLIERQKSEMDSLTNGQLSAELESLEVKSDEEGDSRVDLQVEESKIAAPSERTMQDEQPRTKKPNRQKARLARRAAEQEAQATAAAEEAANVPDLRAQEKSAMKGHIDRLRLTETFIQPDGHCLYSACALNLPSDQAQESKSQKTPGYQTVRSAAAEFISGHPDDFAPFLEEPLDSYVKKIKDTAEWGGQLELQAIARHFKISIHVLQADGRVENISPDVGDPSKGDVWLAYYRHSFGLGEHYNALKEVGT